MAMQNVIIPDLLIFLNPHETDKPNLLGYPPTHSPLKEGRPEEEEKSTWDP